MKITDFGKWYYCCPSVDDFRLNKKLYVMQTLPDNWVVFDTLYDGESYKWQDILSLEQIKFLAKNHGKINLGLAIEKNEYSDTEVEYMCICLKNGGKNE